MSISFGVAVASLAAALFIPDRFNANAQEMIHGVHQAFLMLGGLTILSTIVFRELRNNDGANVSQHKVIMPESSHEIAGTAVAAPAHAVKETRTNDRASV
jgi:hypothetical protein